VEFYNGEEATGNLCFIEQRKKERERRKSHLDRSSLGGGKRRERGSEKLATKPHPGRCWKRKRLSDTRVISILVSAKVNESRENPGRKTIASEQLRERNCNEEQEKGGRREGNHCNKILWFGQRRGGLHPSFKKRDYSIANHM